MISSQAIIHPNAKIAANVSIGPWTLIGADVAIGEGTTIASHVVIQGHTSIGQNNKIYQFVSLGEPPQHLGDAGENTQLIIGNNNTIREYCSFHRGTVQGGGITKVGDHNYFMTYVHLGHDCHINNHSTFTNNASLAGHVTVEDYVVLGAFSGAHQFCRIGAYSMLGAGGMIGQDMLPFTLASGYPASIYGLNIVGLRRRGFKAPVIQALKHAYKIIFDEQLPLQEVVAQLQPLAQQTPEVQRIIDAIAHSKRGIIRKHGRPKE